MSDSLKKRYQLRYAAGLYWLLDMEQPGVPYKKPLPLNETGAGIWKKIESGMGMNEIAEDMSRHYDVPFADMRQDIECFFKQLEQCGIVL